MREKLTKSDVEKIQAEIEHRKLEVRPKCLEAVKEARAHGDLSENFEYHAAKKDKNQNESRIRYLENMLKNAIVISDESRSDEVGLNKAVTSWSPASAATPCTIWSALSHLLAKLFCATRWGTG